MKPIQTALFAVALAGCASPETTGRALVDGAAVTYSRSGQSVPAIVFQSGLGDDRSTWAGMMQALQGEHMVIAFDRPGYGASPAGKASRDPCQIAAETRGLLRELGVKPPYVLVGHSLGGLYQYVYARLYPEDVAGLVLLDPTHPRHWELLQHHAPATSAAVQVLRATMFGSTARAEFDSQAQCLERIAHDRPLGVSTQLLVSTRFSALESLDVQAQVLWPLREDWRQLTGAGPLVRVEAGHYIHRDAAVARAIRAVASARGASAL